MARVLLRGRLHFAIAKEIRWKELSSITKEALDTNDEDGKEKLDEHTADIDVQEDDGHWRRKPSSNHRSG